MGVSGCGKSTIAKAIAQQLHAHFKDGDELHPKVNIEKMAAGIALTDSDREPWLDDIARYAREKATQHGVCVIACSALKRRYRKILNDAGRVVYVYLHGSLDTIASRMQTRTGHFMPEALLQSQFDALEDPRAEDNVVVVGIDEKAAVVASNAIQALHQHNFLVSGKANG